MGDFFIENGILKKYAGPGGSVSVPDGVTGIGRFAFSDCAAITQIVLPEGVTSIGSCAFANCGSLARVLLPDSMARIGEDVLRMDGKPRSFDEIADILRKKDGSPHEIIGCYRTDGPCVGAFLLPADRDSATRFDLMVVRGATADGQGTAYRMDLDGRVRGALLRLTDGKIPVAEKMRPAFRDFLSKRTVRAIRYAEETGKPEYIRALDELGAVDDRNLNAVVKRLKSSRVPEIRALFPVFDRRKTALEVGGENAKALKKTFAIDAAWLPELLKKDGTPLGLAERARLLVVHGLPDKHGLTVHAGEKPGICPEARKIVDELDPGALQAWLRELADRYLGAGKHYTATGWDALAYPICRYADEALMEELCRRAPGWMSRTMVEDTPTFSEFRKAVCFSTTRAALFFAEKYGGLRLYATVRGTDEDTVRDKWFSDVGLNEAGEKRYDLGNQTVILKLRQDFKYALADGSGKAVNSIPRRGADPEKYEKAVEDSKRVQKETKKIVTRRFDAIFADFLSGRPRSCTSWREGYLHNPILRQAAGMVVWTQGADTFLLTPHGPVDSSGRPYTMDDGDIRVAHPMEMNRADLRRWQTYFTSHSIKQPFEQVWEPVIDLESVTDDRYEGQKLSISTFMHREKHGITFFDFVDDPHFSLPGCELEHTANLRKRYLRSSGDTFTLGKLKIKSLSRAANHTIALLDRWTIVGRIRNDDVTVRDTLDRCTPAQIFDFITIAAESNSPNCAAMLLEYKKAHYPDLDPLAEFTLEL